MRRTAWLVALLVLACGARNEAAYPAAAVAAAAQVGMTAVHRAATGGCWADCHHGTTCNHETGVCEQTAEAKERKEPAPPVEPIVAPPTACAPRCHDHEVCVIESTGYERCEARPAAPAASSSAGAAPSAPLAPTPTR